MQQSFKQRKEDGCVAGGIEHCSFCYRMRQRDFDKWMMFAQKKYHGNDSFSLSDLLCGCGAPSILEIL